MYRINKEVASFLGKYTKMAPLPEVAESETRVFTPESTKAIGYMDVVSVTSSSFEYIVEADYAVPHGDHFDYDPEVEGYWLYKRDELKKPKEPVLVPRYFFDPNVTNTEEKIDVSDCCVEVAAGVDKLTCPQINSVSRLLEVEPAIVDCLMLSKKEIKDKYGA